MRRLHLIQCLKGFACMVPQVLLVEDSAPMREAVSRILTEECEVVVYVDNGSHALAAALEHRPQVIVLDISLPGMSGMAVLPLLRASLPGTTIVMLTNHADEEYVEEAFRRGADAYILKSEAHESLLPAVRRGRTATHDSSIALSLSSAAIA